MAKKDTIQKVALLEMMGNYLKENNGKRLIAYDEREIKDFFEVIEKRSEVSKCMIVCFQREPKSGVSMILNDEVSVNETLKQVTKY